MMHHPQQDEQSKKALSKLQILAIFENNQAVELLRRGQCDAAITQLSASLKKQQKVMTAMSFQSDDGVLLTYKGAKP